MHSTISKNPNLRDKLNIPKELWYELEPQLRDKIKEARKAAKAKLEAEKASTSNSEKLPSQYPHKVNKTKAESYESLVIKVTLLTMDDGDDSTDDEAMRHVNVT